LRVERFHKNKSIRRKLREKNIKKVEWTEKNFFEKKKNGKISFRRKNWKKNFFRLDKNIFNILFFH
jgi:hypothetical protein